MGLQYFVTNQNDFEHQDTYNGETFLFPPKVPVLISAAAADHFFGRNLPDKTETLVRLGWAMRYNATKKTFEEDAEGVRKLANFVFEEAVLTRRSLLERADELPIA